MDDTTAQIIISISEGRFEISGSEKFVSDQIENFKDQIIQSFSQPNGKPRKPTTKADDSTITDTGSNSDGTLESYSDIYTIDDNKIKVICEIKETTVSKKVLKLATLYAYGKKLQGLESASVEEIKEECITHGILDTTNFSKHIKNGDPSYYIDKGLGASRVIKLNIPGTKAAVEYINEILANKN
jgi:hypothetical protein